MVKQEQSDYTHRESNPQEYRPISQLKYTESSLSASTTKFLIVLDVANCIYLYILHKLFYLNIA